MQIRPGRLPGGALFAALAVLLGAPAAARAVPQVSIDVTSITFPGSVMVGLGSHEAQFRVTSVGTHTVRLLRWKLEGQHPEDFRVAGCGFFGPEQPFDLPPGQSCPGQVGFRPKAPGARSAQLVIDTTDPAHRRIVVPLSGLAHAAASDLQVVPGQLAFGLQRIGTVSAPQTVELRSVGVAPLTITSLSAPGPSFEVLPHSCTVIQPHTSCAVQVRFRPSLLLPHVVTLRIQSDDPQGPVDVALSGTGSAPHLDAASSLVYGSVPVGSSFTRDVEVRNTSAPGSGRLQVASAVPFGPRAADFTVVSFGTCADVPEGGSCLLKVSFRPIGSGPSGAELHITSDGDGAPGSSSVRAVQLDGAGQFQPFTSPLSMPAASDVAFPVPGSSTTCTPSGLPGLQFAVPVTRAFGSRHPGPPATAQPTIAAAVASGALRATARVEMMVFHQGPPSPHEVRVDFPSVAIGTIAPPPGVWSLQFVDMPIERVHFPPVAPVGFAPTPPPSNVVFVRPDPNGAGSCLSVAWARVVVKAVSPVILVHGDGSDGAFFARQGLTGALSASGVPADSSLNMAGGGSASVAANAAAMQTTIPGIVRSFGVDSVHLVTHSKGGLDARLWLSINAAANAAGTTAVPGGFRVLSVTTLGTPHRGSPLADLAVAVGGGLMVGSAPAGPALFAARPSMLDLTTFAGAFFDPPLPSGADYATIAADVDADANGVVTSVPTDEYAAARSEHAVLASLFAFDPAMADALANDVHSFLRSTRAVIGVPLPVPVPTGIPFLPPVTTVLVLPLPGPPTANDLLVRTDSANGAPAPFVPASGTSLFLADHAGVASRSVGFSLVPLVRDTDRRRGDLR
ncbi:MAG: choice-of-anchor D domain-containing protein [Vicinamibacteria bacterium]